MERLRASLVIDKLAQDYRRFFAIEAYLWEHEPMLSAAHFQDAIEPPSAFDVVILILWSRLGTPLPPATALREYRGADGRAPVTGTEWEYEDALRAAKASGLPDLMVFRNTSMAPIDTQNPAARAQAIDQLAALDTFWRLHFADGGTFRYAFDNYETLEQFAARLEEALRKVIERRIKANVGAPASVEPLWLGDPFRGLEAYEFAHAPIFFGRDAQIAKAVEQLVRRAEAGTAFLLVSGASGSGKSSLVKAAVAPRLMKPQRISGAAFVRRATMRAGAGGADPFLALAKALTEAPSGDGVGLPELLAPGQDAAALAAHLRDATGDPGYAFGGALGRLTEALRKQGRILAYELAKLVLVIDQFEELFTVATITAEVRRAFVGLIGKLARSGHVWVIATLRADFWPLAAEMPELIALAEGDGRLDLAPPSLAEQAEIIRKPAAAAGLSFEVHRQAGVGLDAVLAEHAAAAPGVLPLLSFTLDELYRDARRRGEDVLSYESYDALGGLQGAIAKRAEEVTAALSPAAQAALPSVLRALATASNVGDAIAVSRSAPLADFPPGSPARQIVDAMIAARLLVAEGGDPAPTVRLAHEALIAGWRRAADQLTADRRDLETRALTEEHFNRWRNAGRPAGRLLRNPDLANAVDLSQRWRDELAAPLRDYIRHSSRRARLGQTLAAAAAAVFFLVAVAAIFEGLLAQSKQREAAANYRLALDQAAGGVSLLDKGFSQGAINSRLMMDLVKRSEQTVNQLPGDSDDVTAARVKLLLAIAPDMVAIGDTGKAGEYAAAAAKLVDGLLAKDAGRFEWRRLRAQSRMVLGDVTFWDGSDATVAMAQLRASIDEFKRLAAERPDDDTINENLAASYDSLGDSLRAIGDYDGATAAFTDWLNTASALADHAGDPRQADHWLSYAADAHLRLGDVFLQRKRLDDEIAEYQRGVDIAEKISADDPEDTKSIETASMGHGKLGEALTAAGRLDEAMAQIDRDLDQTNKLVTDFSANIRWLIYQEWAHLRKGRAEMAAARYAQAYDEFTAYLQGVEGMRQRDPAYVSALFDESNAHQWRGDALRLQNKLDDAAQEYESARLSGVEVVRRSPPTNQAAKKILAMADYRLGLLAEAKADTREAVKHYRDCFSVKFNRDTWTPRANAPEDVTEECRISLVRLGAAP